VCLPLILPQSLAVIGGEETGGKTLPKVDGVDCSGNAIDRHRPPSDRGLTLK
jgi:hypothetical protein